MSLRRALVAILPSLAGVLAFWAAMAAMAALTPVVTAAANLPVLP